MPVKIMQCWGFLVVCGWFLLESFLCLTLNCSACHCSALVHAACTWTNRALSVAAWESTRTPWGKRVIQSIWEKCGLLPCTLASCPSDNPCSLTLQGQWGCSHKQIHVVLDKKCIFLSWHEILSLTDYPGKADMTMPSVRQLVRLSQSSWEVWELTDSGHFSLSGKVSCKVAEDVVPWISRMSSACLLHLLLQPSALLFQGRSFTSCSTEEELFWNKSPFFYK